jgi:hypothetical protein
MSIYTFYSMSIFFSGDSRIFRMGLQENLPQKPAGMGFRLLRHLFRGAGGHKTAPAVAAFRAQVDEVVRGLADLEDVAEGVTGVLRV